MAKTLVDIDEHALAEAQEALGTTTKVATVNAALRHVAREKLRREALEREISRAGTYLEAVENREEAWH